jgi:PAS domain S-box-containing protein
MPLSRADPAWVVKLVSALASVTWTATGDGYVIDIEQWSTLTGQSPEQARGEGWLDAVHKGDVDRVQSAWRTAVSHASEYNTDFRVFCADGVHRWFNARAIPILDVEGTVLNWVGVLLPVPGQHRLAPASSVKLQDLEPLRLAALLRACRGALGWSANELAVRAELSVSTVRRLEGGDGAVAARLANIERAHRAFQANGVRIALANGELVISIPRSNDSALGTSAAIDS